MKVPASKGGRFPSAVLSEIAEVQIGYQHREPGGPITPSTPGSYRIVQIKDLDESGHLVTDHLWRVTPSGDAKRYRVSEGDILFLSRGNHPKAVPVREPLTMTVASNFFYIVRVRTEVVHPEYLAWYLNQPWAKAQIRKKQHGSHIKIVPKNLFENLEIRLPSLQAQKAIMELDHLRWQEEQMVGRLVEARRRLVYGLALEAASRAHPN